MRGRVLCLNHQCDFRVLGQLWTFLFLSSLKLFVDCFVAATSIKNTAISNRFFIT